MNGLKMQEAKESIKLRIREEREMLSIVKDSIIESSRSFTQLDYYAQSCWEILKFAV